MATSGYINGRKKYYRPQAMLWSDSPGTLSNGIYVPSGFEKYSNLTGLTPAQVNDSFLILSDHNRNDLDVSTQRFEQRQRMINGSMRSYHIADKLTISTSWNLLPSRSYSFRPDFNQTTGIADTNSTISNPNPPPALFPIEEYTADGGAGGAEMLEWYQNHTGPFWVFLAYDKFTNFGNDDAAYLHLPQYNQVLQMYISSFNYSVVKRGQAFNTGRDEEGNIIRTGGYDMWNITLTLEEV